MRWCLSSLSVWPCPLCGWTRSPLCWAGVGISVGSTGWCQSPMIGGGACPQTYRLLALRWRSPSFEPTEVGEVVWAVACRASGAECRALGATDRRSSPLTVAWVAAKTAGGLLVAGFGGLPSMWGGLVPRCGGLWTVRLGACCSWWRDAVVSYSHWAGRPLGLCCH